MNNNHQNRCFKYRSMSSIKPLFDPNGAAVGFDQYLNSNGGALTVKTLGQFLTHP
jgi:hypothetical protein